MFRLQVNTPRLHVKKMVRGLMLKSQFTVSLYSLKKATPVKITAVAKQDFDVDLTPVR